jgi:hypothetical protein
MAAPAPKRTSDQQAGAWIFGTLLLAFYVYVFQFGPGILPDYKFQMLGIISALLGGLFTYFLTGQIVTTVKAGLSAGAELAVRATGGAGVAAVLLLWWGHGPGPIQTSSQAAAQLQQELQTASQAPPEKPATVSPAPGTSPPVSPPARVVTLSPKVQKLAEQLAAQDPKYKDVGVLANKSRVSLSTVDRVANALSAARAKKE